VISAAIADSMLGSMVMKRLLSKSAITYLAQCRTEQKKNIGVFAMFGAA
jgi:hypothetical protein